MFWRILLLILALIVFIGITWVLLSIGLTLGSIPGILSGTNDISFGYGDPLFWVFFIILIIYWIVLSGCHSCISEMCLRQCRN